MPALKDSWTETTKFIVARWRLCAKMGLTFSESPDGCAALADLFEKMAKIIDEEIDRREGAQR